jgi:hypothetical protein
MLRVRKLFRSNQTLLVWHAICPAAALLAAGTLPFLARTPQSPATDPSYKISKDVPVPMRDGVILRADVLLPALSGRFPTLVYRTPYNKESALRDHKTFEKAVARGYAVVVQDVRGRYASDGEFNAYWNEGHDGSTPSSGLRNNLGPTATRALLASLIPAQSNGSPPSKIHLI